jgi:uncharacterized protein (TIGR03435 family)
MAHYRKLKPPGSDSSYVKNEATRSTFLMMHRRLCLLAAAIVLTVNLVHAQTAAPVRLEFEVASVKPANPDARGGGIKAMPGGQRYVATNVPVRLMFRLMYRLTESQLSGGPAWFNTERYNIDARADHPYNLDDLHVMFQNLLADRFKVQFHKEPKELPFYALMVDKSGSKMKLNQTPQDFEIPFNCSGFGNCRGTRIPMGYFSWILSGFLDRPVIDKTGLDNFYDFQLHYTPELPQGISKDQIPPGTDLDGPTIFTALKEQLGLKLEAQKGPVDIYVIDHAEKPAEN